MKLPLPKLSLRQGLLFGVLGLTLAASAWVWWQDQEGQAQTEDAPAAQSLQMAEPGTPATGTPGAPLDPMASVEGEPPAAGTPVDIFAPRNWLPPPPPPAAEEELAPKEPEAPPLPFKFLGRIEEPGQPDAYLLGRGHRTVLVKVGDFIDGGYQVVKYQGGRLIFLYRPMNVRQELYVGGAS